MTDLPSWAVITTGLLALCAGFFGFWLHDSADREKLSFREWLDQRTAGMLCAMSGFAVAVMMALIWATGDKT